VGSSNLTDGGLRSNREATICLDQPDDLDDIEELRSLFHELWDSAQVLTAQQLKIFTEAHQRVKHSGPDADTLILGSGVKNLECDHQRAVTARYEHWKCRE
jgi:phosphatidylserine/phosphatidylglycerophosphate/cardiolipin synthase-like enzyme